MIEQGSLASTSFQLPDRSEVVTADIHRISFEDDRIVWRGKINCTEGTVLFIMQGGILDGYIQLGNTSYEIRSICDNFGYLYIAETPDEGDNLCADHGEISPVMSEIQPYEILSNYDAGNNQCCISTVLFLYTALSNEYGDPILASVIGLVDINTALQNNAICHKVEQVGLLPFDFIEGENIGDNRDALIVNEEIQALREQFASDIVILITGDVYGQFGISTLSSFGDPDFSHAIVVVNAPSGRHTLAHEWAHDNNANHNNGLRFGDTDEYNTMMNPLPLNQSRILHYSNPQVNFDGFATGIEITDDNAGRLNNWGCYVSEYTYSGNPCESVYSNITSETLFIEDHFVSRYCLDSIKLL